MNALQQERNRKLKEEVKNDLKVFKQQAEIRKYNEEKLREQLGIQRALTDFHKPVTEKMEQHEEARMSNMQALKEVIDSIPLAIDNSTLAIEQPLDIYDFDKELDIDYLEKNNFPRPSKLYNESQETLQEIMVKVKLLYAKMARQKGNIMSQLSRMATRDYAREEQLLEKADYLREHMGTLDDYRERLRDLQRKEIYRGKGLEDKMDILAQLTDKICRGSKGKKLHNQVVDVLDVLLREGAVTVDFVKQYYKNFSSNK